MPVLKIATRQSPLALWQAEYIKSRLEELHSDLTVELVKFVTQGDKILDAPLAKIGGKGLFVKELEQALFDGRADLAVHSLKDVPMELPEGLCLPVICERENPYDAFVSNDYIHFNELPQGAIVGTSSLRRKCQLMANRPDLRFKDLRGNVGTRLGKLDAGEYDAIILATAGLIRLDLPERIRHTIDPLVSLPAVGQGALGLECRKNDSQTKAYILPLLHEHTAICVGAERAFNHRLMGGCQVPIAGFATLDNNQVSFKGLVASLDASIVLQETAIAPATLQDAQRIGIEVADKLMAKGAKEILANVYAN